MYYFFLQSLFVLFFKQGKLGKLDRIMENVMKNINIYSFLMKNMKNINNEEYKQKTKMYLF